MDLGLPMTGGSLQTLPANAPLSSVVSVLNNIIYNLNNQLQTQVFADSTSKRMIIGFQKDGWGTGKDFGIKVSLPGVDVTQATDAQLLFKMDLQTWSWYDPSSHKNFMQLGVLPDGSGGVVVAAPGLNVSDLF